MLRHRHIHKAVVHGLGICPLHPRNAVGIIRRIRPLRQAHIKEIQKGLVAIVILIVGVAYYHGLFAVRAIPKLLIKPLGIKLLIKVTHGAHGVGIGVKDHLGHIPARFFIILKHLEYRRIGLLICNGVCGIEYEIVYSGRCKHFDMARDNPFIPR